MSTCTSVPYREALARLEAWDTRIRVRSKTAVLRIRTNSANPRNPLETSRPCRNVSKQAKVRKPWNGKDGASPKYNNSLTSKVASTPGTARTVLLLGGDPRVLETLKLVFIAFGLDLLLLTLFM